MNKTKIITDSTSNLSKTIRDEFDIDYFMMTFSINGNNYDADLDWGKISPVDYYNLMREGKRAITGLVKTGEIENKFEKYLNEGYDILYIACSSKLSGSLNYAKIVASDYIDRYPNKIICFDSLRSNCSQGMMAIKASTLAKEGKSIDEINSFLLRNRLKYQTYAIVSSLEWLKKSGRVKYPATFVGETLGVKPIIFSGYDGNNFAFKKVKGRKTSIEYVADIINERIDRNVSVIFIEHADCLEDANYLKERILSLKKIDVIISNLGPIVGATTGPDSLTVSFYGKKVTQIENS